MKKLLIILLFMPLLVPAQLTIKEPILMEYQSGIHASDGNIYTYFASIIPVAIPLPGGRKVLKASGGFNRFRAVDENGAFWTSKQYNEPSPMVWTQYLTDTTGASFTDNTYVAAFEDIYITIRKDGSLWYGGDDYFRFFYSNGVGNMRPTKISPAGLIFTKVSIGNHILALTDKGEVYQWNYRNKTPVKVNLPGTASWIATSWYDACFAVVNGRPYAWGTAWGSWGSKVFQTLSSPTDMSALWMVSARISEISADRQAVHYIDTLHRLFCPASYNVQGEAGTGQDYTNRYTYPSYPGGGWSYKDWEFPTTPTGIPIRPDVQWAHLYDNNWHSFYKLAVDIAGNLYGAGRNKTNVMWFGHIYDPNGNGWYPNDWDVPSWTLIPHPFTTVLKFYTRVNPVRGAIFANNTLTYTGHMALAVNGKDTARGRVVMHKWRQLSGPAQLKIDCPGCPSTAVSGLLDGSYVFQDSTVDDYGCTDTSQVKFTIALRKPTARIWVDSTTIHWPNTVFALADSSLNSTSSQWLWYSGPNRGIWTSPGPGDRRMFFSGVIPGTYVLTLFVNGTNNQTDSTNITLTVVGPPPCPVAPRRIAYTITVYTDSTRVMTQ